MPHELAPSTQRGGFLVQCTVFAHWDAVFQRFGLHRFVAQNKPRHSEKRRGVHRVWNCVPPLMVLELVLEIGAPREARWRCLSTSDGASWLDCASHFDVTSFDVNILAPFGADSRISRTARRMAHDLLCAALLLLGCLRPARATRLAIAALGICRASYLGLLLDAASSFSSTAARACLSSQHTARERTRPIPSRVRGLFMLIVVHNNRLGRPRCRVLSFV